MLRRCTVSPTFDLVKSTIASQWVPIPFLCWWFEDNSIDVAEMLPAFVLRNGDVPRSYLNGTHVVSILVSDSSSTYVTGILPLYGHVIAESSGSISMEPMLFYCR